MREGLLTLALVGILIGGTAPGLVIVEGQTFLAVGTSRLVLAAADHTLLQALPCAADALAGMAIAAASAIHTHMHATMSLNPTARRPMHTHLPPTAKSDTA